MYNSTLVEQFITDIKVIDLGQTVIIDCCPTGYCENDDSIYQFICLKCEEVKLNFYEHNKKCIYKDGCIDLLEFSVTQQKDGKISVYIYGRVVALEVICEEVKSMKTQ
ncbi:hypothetical protein H1P_3970007 [Hyella patelloides LEGE 07179]|uniref:Uncharacterized protein n=1 Tax=Hyella patelloides LEGE 07179 TaxID=945734 RepID=A0A563VX38_9CYAN|nr:hypothetical protein [Hyella patelloides]VEP16012.1 hypothetical protein H1P_3970007 [Hyella patelloides LEGE 07179]